MFFTQYALALVSHNSEGRLRYGAKVLDEVAGGIGQRESIIKTVAIFKFDDIVKLQKVLRCPHNSKRE